MAVDLGGQRITLGRQPVDGLLGLTHQVDEPGRIAAPNLVTTGHASADVGLPLWVIVSGAGAISLGTYSGGWRIMRTMGRRIIHLDPPRAFSAESTAASILYITAYVYHAPISTTQVITSVARRTHRTPGLARAGITG